MSTLSRVHAIDGNAATVLGGVKGARAYARRLRRPWPRLRAVRRGICRWHPENGWRRMSLLWPTTTPPDFIFSS